MAASVTWRRAIQKEPSGARWMLSGDPGRLSTKVSFWPALSPFSHSLVHLNLRLTELYGHLMMELLQQQA